MYVQKVHEVTSTILVVISEEHERGFNIVSPIATEQVTKQQKTRSAPRAYAFSVPIMPALGLMLDSPYYEIMPA